MRDECVTSGKVVGIAYTLADDAGRVVVAARADEALQYLHGASNIVPGLEAALLGRRVGDRVQVTVPPSEGYGDRHGGGVHQVPRAQFPSEIDIQVGMSFGAEGPGGDPVPVWVLGVDADRVTIDFNHPLAGKHLHFDATVVSLRDATPEEIAHGHPHGPGGHHA